MRVGLGIADSDQNVQVDELAVAYGQRALPKLVEFLSLNGLSEDSTAKCLRLILSLTSSQASIYNCVPSDSRIGSDNIVSTHTFTFHLSL